MFLKKFLFIFLIFSFVLSVHSNEAEKLTTEEKIEHKKRVPKYKFEYVDRKHTRAEAAKHVGIVYALSWGVYPLTQPKTFKQDGSWDKYRHNFGKIVFDRDEPFWNWFVHPISGSQMYLFYRANGYNRVDSLGLSFISSALFEFTVEIYTEPASVQDLYQTPVLGAVLGLGLENLSLYLLNTGNAMGRFFGHLLNPATLFPFYEGKIRILPQYNGRDAGGLQVMVDF